MPSDLKKTLTRDYVPDEAFKHLIDGEISLTSTLDASLFAQRDSYREILNIYLGHHATEYLQWEADMTAVLSSNSRARDLFNALIRYALLNSYCVFLC
jgi:hypothetical protein